MPNKTIDLMVRVIQRLIGAYVNTLSIIAPACGASYGFRIWCRPIRAKLKPHHRDFMATAEKIQLEYRGEKIQGYRWGNGAKKILFVHGWQSHTFRWKRYIDNLCAEDVTLYAFDAPGHGFSTGNFLHVPLYSEVLGAFLEKVGGVHSAVCHSVGCFAMLHLLHHQPDIRLEELVLMAPPRQAKDFIGMAKDTLYLSNRSVRLICGQFEKRILHPIEYYSTEKFANNLTMPGLIIHDKDDAETPYEASILINTVWEQSKLVTTSGLYHNLKSPKVVKAVKDFVLGVPHEDLQLEKSF